MKDDRAYKTYEKEISKDLKEIEKHKSDYIKMIKNGLGNEINSFDSYIKKEPSKWVKFKNFISKIFKHL
jgi:hypothetical protein